MSDSQDFLDWIDSLDFTGDELAHGLVEEGLAALPGVSDGGSLPVGWTGDEANPQNVDSNGGELTLPGANLTVGDVTAEAGAFTNGLTVTEGITMIDGGAIGNAYSLSLVGDGGDIDMNGDGIQQLSVINPGLEPLQISGDTTFSGSVGFFTTAPTTKQTNVQVTAEGIHAALVNLGLIAGP